MECLGFRKGMVVASLNINSLLRLRSHDTGFILYRIHDPIRYEKLHCSHDIGLVSLSFLVLFTRLRSALHCDLKPIVPLPLRGNNAYCV